MIKINQKALKALLGGVLFSTKPATHVGDVLSHVAIESSNGVIGFTTCDGYRISQTTSLYTTEDFSQVLHVNGLTAVYKLLSPNTYDFVCIEPGEATWVFSFTGYSLLVDVVPIRFINPNEHVPHSRDAEAWLTLNPKQALCMLPKHTKKPQYLKIRLDPEHAIMGLSVPNTFGIQVDASYDKSPREEYLQSFNYAFFYQAINTFKGEDKVTLKFFKDYRGMVLSNDTSYYWVLPVRTEAENIG